MLGTLGVEVPFLQGSLGRVCLGARGFVFGNAIGALVGIIAISVGGCICFGVLQFLRFLLFVHVGHLRACCRSHRHRHSPVLAYIKPYHTIFSTYYYNSLFTVMVS